MEICLLDFDISCVQVEFFWVMMRLEEKRGEVTKVSRVYWHKKSHHGQEFESESTTGQTQSADKAHVVWSKASEQLLNGPCG